jgi:hypothetical protein
LMRFDSTESLPDAVKIAGATREWLKVFRVERTERVEALRSAGLGLGEAEMYCFFAKSNRSVQQYTFGR